MVQRSWLSVLFLCLTGCTREAPKAASNVAMEQKITAPTESDRKQLAERESAVLRLIQARHPDAKLIHDENDLQWLQRLVDEKTLRPNQTYELQSLGLVLGQVFVAQTPLKWIVVEDEFGRDLALQYPNTSVIVFPLTMISKRVEDGRDVEVLALYRTVVTQVDKMKDDPEYKR